MCHIQLATTATVVAASLEALSDVLKVGRPFPHSVSSNEVRRALSLNVSCEKVWHIVYGRGAWMLTVIIYFHEICKT